MLPPVDEDMLRNNPEFANVYKTITGSLLNPDGSTKGDTTAKKRDVVREELKAHRLKSTRLHLLHQAIATAVPRPTPAPESSQPQERAPRRTKSRAQPTASLQAPTLPPELLDLLLLIPVFLSKASSMSASSLVLLLSNPPFTKLPAYFPQIVSLVSARLTRQANTLARVLNPNTNPSYIHRSIPSLHATTAALLSHLSESKLLLSQARLQATHVLTRYLAQHTAALTLLLRALEAKHGSAARSTELRAEEAGLDAQSWAIASEALLWDMRREVYPPEARTALENYRRHLRDARRRLADGAKMREAELRDYGVVGSGSDQEEEEDDSGENKTKERTMREMARVWREMDTRLREVRGDIHRLG